MWILRQSAQTTLIQTQLQNIEWLEHKPGTCIENSCFEIFEKVTRFKWYMCAT